MDDETDTGAVSFEAKTIRKLRIKILPFVFVLYTVAFLDRINIGFAALTMNKHLAITSQQFGLVAGIFFFGYFFFEVPSNLLLHKIGARIWIARILISWGMVAMLTAFVHNVHQLYVVRFLLGVAEAGFFPGIILYLTYWFRQREQAQAIALFMTALPVTSILGAPVSGLILDNVHCEWGLVGAIGYDGKGTIPPRQYFPLFIVTKEKGKWSIAVMHNLLFQPLPPGAIIGPPPTK